MTGRRGLAVILALQGVCAFFFVWDILSSIFGFRSTPISWEARELIEIGAALGLVLGLLLGAIALRRTDRARTAAEARLHRASQAFIELLQERFAAWGLTEAERDVALFAIKGLSTAEIAALRSTAEGTVKAQTAAIYRKAGVSGRPQLLALFIDDLLADPTAGASTRPS